MGVSTQKPNSDAGILSKNRERAFSMLGEVEDIVCTGSGGDKDQYGLHLAKPCPTCLL